MTAHVDVVVNRWAAGEQEPVARIFVRNGGLQVDSPDPDRWHSTVDQALANLPVHDPERALSLIAGVLQGSYLFATQPHDDEVCPYHGWHHVAIQSMTAESATISAAGTVSD